MLGPESAAAVSIDNIAHIIQIALTPVFLLSGIAALLNVFASRLARVSDRGHQITAAIESASEATRRQLEVEFRFLHRRSLALDAAVLLGTTGGAATCLAAVLLFLGSLRNTTIAGLLYLSFALALFCTMGALGAFMAEMLMASRGLRQRQADVERRVGQGGAASRP